MSARAAALLRQHPGRAAFVFFALLAIGHTWPLAASPATSGYDDGDAMLNEWAIAWVSHQLARDPLHPFDANIFFPERKTLAYSEPMLLHGVLSAPLAWLGAPTLLVYNLVLLAGFTLTGWAIWRVAARWTGSWAAGAAAGIVAAFNVHTLTSLPHVQALHVEFLPLALAALDAALREPTARRALKLALWFVLQAFASIYLLVFSAVALVAAAAARPRDWLGKRFIPVLACLALAAGVSLVALWPYLQPYWEVHREQGAAPPAGAALFPGLISMTFATIAIIRGIAWRDPRARMCLAVGGVGVALSFGTKLPGYDWLYRTVPLLQAVGAPSQFGYLGILAVGLLAAFGLADLRTRVPATRWTIAAALVLTVLALEPFAAPLSFRPFAGVSTIYESIAYDSRAVVVELPMPSRPDSFFNARYTINSTRHWRPLLNGYSRFAPPSFHEHATALAAFPAPAAVEALKAFGVTHVFLQIDGYTPEQHAIIEASPDLTRIASNEFILLYRVTATAAP